MKCIKIDINENEYTALVTKAGERDIDVKTLLGWFIQDLTCSDRSGGSDERELASDWFSRQCYR